MTGNSINGTQERGKRAWDPMVLTKVGKLGDIMQGLTGSAGETMSGMMAAG